MKKRTQITDLKAMKVQGEQILMITAYEYPSARLCAPAVIPLIPARDTLGNAREARDWAKARGYRSLIVVTSAYHMPRSLSEMSRILPEVELVPVPVQPVHRDLGAWMTNSSTFSLLLIEYVKYILSRLR